MEPLRGMRPRPTRRWRGLAWERRRTGSAVRAPEAGGLLRALVLHLAAAGAAASRQRGPYSHGYGYALHGRDWELGACAAGRKQSPIDLPPRGAGAPSGSFRYDYQGGNASVALAGNGHVYSIDLLGRGYGGILYSGAWYPLVSLSVHVASEHTWAGATAPAELHLVHKRHDAGVLLVVAAALACGRPPVIRPPAVHVPPPAAAPGFSRLVQAFTGVPPPPAHQQTETPLASAADLNGVLDGGEFFAYAGSMTVPPCAEVVTWLVRTEPIMMSDEQGQRLQDAVVGMTGGPGNSRSAMPLNGRGVSLLSALRGARPPPAPAGGGGPPGSEATDRELRVAAAADEALRVATDTMEYLKGINNRALRAARGGMNLTAA